MRTLCIVPCGARKIWDVNPDAGPAKARYVYIGPFAKKCRQYAEMFYPSAWCILSAKYGFLFPEDIVPGPYNVSFNIKKTNPISTRQLGEQAIEKDLTSFERIVVIGGRNYVGMIDEVFCSKEIQTPLAGCKGMGYMMGRLNDAIIKRSPL